MKHYSPKVWGTTNYIPPDMLPYLALLFKYDRGNDVFVCFVTCESVHLSFLALQGKQQSFGFQHIEINVKLLTKYVTPDTLPK